jgi:hypothetical protein
MIIRMRVTLMFALGLTIGAASFVTSVRAQPPARAAAVAIDADDIGGVVTGPNGPEAGVWVIAETRDLPVRYIKIVATDDQGRYVIPDLPRARYSVWARGYGLVDSAKATSDPGKLVNITATPAPTPADAAKYYPAIYWYSMLKIPTQAEMSDRANFANNMTQQRWLGSMKNLGCIGCHQLGQLSTRTIPASLGTFASGADAWHRRVQSGQAGEMMLGQLNGLGPASFKYFGDWTDREGRTAAHETAASPRRRAQHRRHAARLDGRQALLARSHLERSALPDGQRQRSALRIARVQLGPDADSRSRGKQGDDVQAAGARSADAVQLGSRARGGVETAGGVAVLGR